MRLRRIILDREILEAIRDTLGQNASPEIERRYLERLLDIQ